MVVLALAVFMTFLALAFWRMRRKERTTLWLASWLAAMAVFALARLMQYATLSDPTYILVARIVLTAAYALAWLSYEFANSFAGYRPQRWERVVFMILTAAPILLMWTGNLVLTDTVILRNVPFGGEFHGVEVGILYMPASILILGLGMVAPVRLLRLQNSHRRENVFLATGFLLVILFSLNDFVATALNLFWVRLSDFSYLPVSVLFSYIQIERFAQLYRDMSSLVQTRTAELSQANEMLRAQVVGHRLAEENISRKAEEFSALYEVTNDLVAQRDLHSLLELLVERATTLLNAPSGAIFLYDEIQNNLEIVLTKGIQLPVGTRLEMGEGMAGRVAQARQPMILDNYSKWDFRSPKYEGLEMTASIQAPMLYGEKLIGVLDVTELKTTDHQFTEAEMHLLMLFANQAAIAVENARLFEAEERRRQEAAAIAEVGKDISASLQLDIVLERIASHAKDLLGVETSAVYLVEPGTQALRAIAALGPDAEAIKRTPLNFGEGILGSIAIRKTGEIVNDSITDARGIKVSGTEDIPYDHLMGAPVLSKDQLTGLIAVWRVGKGQEFNLTDLDFLTSLAQQAAIAIENARLFEATRRRLAELEIMQTIASALRVVQTPQEVFPIILTQLTNLLDMDCALVDLIDPSGKEIVSVSAQGVWAPVAGLRTSAEVGISSHVISTGQPYITSDVVADGWIARPDLVFGVRAVACIPIVALQHPIGTLWVGRQGETSITREEVNLLTALGEMVGNTIQRMNLYEQTVIQSLEISSAYDLTLAGWAKALELRDKETEGHSRRVTELTLQLARQFGVPEQELPHIHHGVLLHDIGKMGVPDQILKKTGPLDQDEWEEMRKHPQYAYDLLYPITYLRPALDIPYCHHEHWDGSGYPRGLREEQIPLAARIFAVVDAYDALSHDRPYRAAWPEEKVLDYLREQSGKHFDPHIVEAFLAFPLE